MMIADGTYAYDDGHWTQHFHDANPPPSQDTFCSTSDTPTVTSTTLATSANTTIFPTGPGRKVFALPDMSPSERCFALATDFDALALAFEMVMTPPSSSSVLALRSTIAQGSLTVGLFIAGSLGVAISTISSATTPIVIRSFRDNLCILSPSDFELLTGLIEERGEGSHGRDFGEGLGLAGVVDLLEVSGYDFGE